MQASNGVLHVQAPLHIQSYGPINTSHFSKSSQYTCKISVAQISTFDTTEMQRTVHVQCIK